VSRACSFAARRLNHSDADSAILALQAHACVLLVPYTPKAPYRLPDDLDCFFGHLLAPPDFDCCVWCESDNPDDFGAWAA
jgi:hypothetical protein